jgi:hypothetical protein
MYSLKAHLFSQAGDLLGDRLSYLLITRSQPQEKSRHEFRIFTLRSISLAQRQFLGGDVSRLNLQNKLPCLARFTLWDILPRGED